MPARSILWTALAVALGSALAACVSFDLGGRRYRCDQDPAICGDGWACGADGFCVRAVAGADAGSSGDALATPDAPPGIEICENGKDDDGDGDIDCADTDCEEGASCGTGCICRAGGVAEEAACGDMIDNDRDGDVDCNDSDCPSSCGGALVCCPDGCRPSC